MVLLGSMSESVKIGVALTSNTFHEPVSSDGRVLFLCENGLTSKVPSLRKEGHCTD